MNRIASTFFLALNTSNDDSTFWKKYSICSKRQFYQQTNNKKVESFLKSNLTYSKYTKWWLRKAIKVGALTQLICSIFILKVGVMLWKMGQVLTKNLFAQALLKI